MFKTYQEEKEERLQWVSTLKVGDEVAVRGSGWGNYPWHIYKIEKITPTGRLNLQNGAVVNPDGSFRGGAHGHVFPVTEKVKLEIWRATVRLKISKELKVNELSDNNLNRILHILKDNELEREEKSSVNCV